MVKGFFKGGASKRVASMFVIAAMAVTSFAAVGVSTKADASTVAKPGKVTIKSNVKTKSARNTLVADAKQLKKKNAFKGNYQKFAHEYTFWFNLPKNASGIEVWNMDCVNQRSGKYLGKRVWFKEIVPKGDMLPYREGIGILSTYGKGGAAFSWKVKARAYNYKTVTVNGKAKKVKQYGAWSEVKISEKNIRTYLNAKKTGVKKGVKLERFYY